MIGKIYTAARPGLHSAMICVEADILTGLPQVILVGLADHAVRESRERIRSAIYNSGYHFPVKQIVINLAPNDIPKEGGLIELAIAAAILSASGQVPGDCFDNTAFLGALSLDGSIQHARGLCAAVLFMASQPQIQRVVVPLEALSEVAGIPNLEIIPIGHLSELTAIANKQIPAAVSASFQPEPSTVEIDMQHIFGLGFAKEALAVAAVGRHHTLLLGAPGTGKSMLARAYRHLLPELQIEEAIEVTRLYSLAGLTQGKLIHERPFRSPHHTTSTPALVGGSSIPRPGEISLAHRGTLFLDELLEFRNEALQALREPLEERKITISRSRGQMIYPADFQLIAAANPCRCGNLFSNQQKCTCVKHTSLDQFRKIVGPFLDRIAIELDLSGSIENRFEINSNADTHFYRQKIIEARLRSMHRNKNQLNADLTSSDLMQCFSQVKHLHKLYAELAEPLRLSYRAWLNSLRVALSFADYSGEAVSDAHIHYALTLRKVHALRHQMFSRAA